MSKLLDKPTPTVNDLAKKYGVSVLEVKKQLMKGMKVEKEHTNDPKIAREIALDHLGEKLNYYTLLAKIEEEMEDRVGAIMRILKYQRHNAKLNEEQEMKLIDFSKKNCFFQKIRKK